MPASKDEANRRQGCVCVCARARAEIRFPSSPRGEGVNPLRDPVEVRGSVLLEGVRPAAEEPLVAVAAARGVDVDVGRRRRGARRGRRGRGVGPGPAVRRVGGPVKVILARKGPRGRLQGEEDCQRWTLYNGGLGVGGKEAKERGEEGRTG